MKKGAEREAVPLLGGVLLLALSVRLVAVGRMLPTYFLASPTEGDLVDRVLQLFVRFPDLNPRVYDWPTFFQYLSLFAFKLYASIASLAAPGGFAEFYVQSQADRTSVYFICRLLTVLFGVGTAAAAYATARRFYDAHLATLAAAFVALAPVHVEFSQYAQLDAPMTFFSTLAAYACLRIYERGETRDYVLAGIFIGLGAATKYLPAVALAAAVLADRLRGPKANARRLLACALLVPLTFFIASPYSFLKLQSLLDIKRQFNHASRFAPWRQFDVFAAFFVNLGPLALLGAAGTVLFARARPKGAAILGAFPLAVTAFSLFWDASIYYLLPLLPFMGLASCEVVRRLSVRLGSRRAIIATAVIFLWPMLSIAKHDLRILRATTMEEMKSWITTNVPAEAPMVGFMNDANLMLAEFVRQPGDPALYLFSRYRFKYLRNDDSYALARLREDGIRYFVFTTQNNSLTSQALISEVRAVGKLLKEVPSTADRIGPSAWLYEI